MKREYKIPNIIIYPISEIGILCASKTSSIPPKGGKSRGSYGKKIDDALK